MIFKNRYLLTTYLDVSISYIFIVNKIRKYKIMIVVTISLVHLIDDIHRLKTNQTRVNDSFRNWLSLYIRKRTL